jgi:hypothetical protein
MLTFEGWRVSAVREMEEHVGARILGEDSISAGI